MKVNVYHVDAFTRQLFSGNPATVCVLTQWLSEEQLKAMAVENNLPVTAFILGGDGQYTIRWITPDYELDLCGHGTLAASFVIFNYLETAKNQIIFTSPKAGIITVGRDHEWITLNFPIKSIERCEIPAVLASGLGARPIELYQHHDERLLAVFENEEIIKNMTPDMPLMKHLKHRGIVVTAPSMSVDFVSRTFYPWKSIAEDPVTGASHCLLVPYWAKRLGKTNLLARQLSKRGGELKCEYKNNHILLSSQAVLYAQGVIDIELL